MLWRTSRSSSAWISRTRRQSFASSWATPGSRRGPTMTTAMITITNSFVGLRSSIWALWRLDPNSGGRPRPSTDLGRLQAGAVQALEVGERDRGPGLPRLQRLNPARALFGRRRRRRAQTLVELLSRRSQRTGQLRDLTPTEQDDHDHHKHDDPVHAKDLSEHDR